MNRFLNRIYKRKYSTLFSRENTRNFIEWRKKQEKISKLPNKYLLLNNLDTETIRYDKDNKDINLNFDNLWKKIGDVRNSNKLITTGVRNSLNGLFGVIKKLGYHLIIPNDVYPVYTQIAVYNNVEYSYYTSVNKIIYDTLAQFDEISINHQKNKDKKDKDKKDKDKDKKDKEKDKKYCILMTIPHTPTGTILDDYAINELYRWLIWDSSQILIIDSEYAYDSSIYQNKFDKLFDTGQVIICNSLSKSFLLPSHLGVIYLPHYLSHYENYLKIDRPNHNQLLKAFEVVNNTPYLPKYQSELFESRWQGLEPLMKDIEKHWKRPDSGYLSVLPVNHEELIDKYNILAVPSYVYSSVESSDSKDQYSIISCLNESIYLKTT